MKCANGSGYAAEQSKTLGYRKNMENENKIKLLEEGIIDESALDDEEYLKKIIDLCDELDKRPYVDGTYAILEVVKRWNLK